MDAFLITDILSDNEARSAAFGPSSVLTLGDRPVAAKTGTTNDYRDNWTMGYTPQLVTGVWVGNSDNSPMRNISGVAGAGPIWNEFMRVALAGEPALAFAPPAGVRQVEVCADTGTVPSIACPERRTRWFAEDRPPLPKEKDLWQNVRMVRGANELATEFTPADQIEERPFKIYPPEYRAWAEQHGIPQPPPGALATPVNAGELRVGITSPGEGAVVSGVVSVFGSASVPDFGGYELQYGISHDPGAFSPPIYGPAGAPVLDGQLGWWDTSGLGNGPHTLRLLVRDTRGAQYEARVRLFVQNETSTPLTPEAPTATPFVEPPTPTWTPEQPTPTTVVVPPTETPLPTDTPTVEVPPTETPTFEATPTWTSEPPTEAPIVSRRRPPSESRR